MTVPLGMDAWEPGTRPRRIRDCVARAFEIEPHRMAGRSRLSSVVKVRHLAMWVVKQCCPDMSYPMIGRVFGDRDHSTAIHGVRATEARFERDPEFAAIGTFLVDSIGTAKGTFVFDDAMRERIARAVAAIETSAAPVAEPPAGAGDATAPIPRWVRLKRPALPVVLRPNVKPKNDFSIRECDGPVDDAMAKLARQQDGLRQGSRNLAAAIAREGLVVR